ncbi:MAG TPA: peptide chain release factor 2 [bacterium]|nr:peptide chain release factor 2 [bacterium]
MFEEQLRQAREAAEGIERLEAFFDPDGLRKKIEDYEGQVSIPGFWNDSEKAQRITRELKQAQDLLAQYTSLQSRAADVIELIEMSAEEEDAESQGVLDSEIAALEKDVSAFFLRRALTGEHDGGNAFLSIHPGAGGTESCDWAEMLLRMYLRWCERRGYPTEVVDIQPGDEAGIRNVTILVRGENAYGYLHSESGIHRLVRISPFDANKRRHTSFASVYVMPELDDNVDVDIRDEDLRVDTYRSSGAGGQHVNTTDSAVRITHLPTGIVVSCQNERSQHKNRATAMKVLRARLYEVRLQEQQDKLDALAAGKKDIRWGNQLRSYVFCPYQMVKDHYTGQETGNVGAVMDGEIDDFIDAALREKIS